MGPFGEFVDKYINQGKWYQSRLDKVEAEYKSHPKWEKNKKMFLEYRNGPVKEFNEKSVYKSICFKTIALSKY